MMNNKEKKLKKNLLIFTMSIFILFSVTAQSSKDYTRFIDVVKNELNEINIKNYEEHFDEQYFIVKEENEYFDIGTQVGLTNLYNVCFQNRKSQWEKIVKNYFSQVKKSRTEEKEILLKLENFDTGKEYLKIRIYPIEYKEQIADSSISESIMDENVSIVVIDFPSAVKILSKDYKEKWGISEKEIFEIAKENTLKNNKEKFEEYEISENFSVSVMLSETNIFITSSIYDINKKCHSISKYGAFISIPNRYGILLKNVNKETINNDIIEMMMLTNYMYQQGPGSISNTIFWFDGEKFYKVIHDPLKGMLKLPDELMEALK